MLTRFFDSPLYNQRFALLLALSLSLMPVVNGAESGADASFTQTSSAASAITEPSSASNGTVGGAGSADPAAKGTISTDSPALDPIQETNSSPAPAGPAVAPPKTPRLIWRQGESLSIGTDTEDLAITDDVELAKKQVEHWPQSPEASFILAVALTRTSRVEEALKEVRRARKLGDSLGGPQYFDKTIKVYEDMLKTHPKENRIRYGLAWAYYMKAYLLYKHSRKLMPPAPAPAGKINPLEIIASGKMPNNPPSLPSALALAHPSVQPEIKRYYERALSMLDDLLAQQPDDIWARVYRAHLKAEYTGNLDEAMATWKKCSERSPDNPAPYFFLGEGYLKQGNLKECLNNVSRAIALRALGK